MTFEVDVREIKKAISLISPIVNLNSAQLPLRYIKICKNDNRIEIKGYNDNIFASSFIGTANIEESKDGDYCYVYAKMFFDLIKSFNGVVKITLNEDSFVIKNSRSKYKINVLDRKTFEDSVQDIEGYYEVKHSNIVNLSELKNKMQSVIHCLSNNDFEPELKHLCFKDDLIVACDGVRGAVIEYDSKNIGECLIHKNIYQCIMNIEDSNEIRFIVYNDILFGKTNNFMFASSLSKLKYPFDDVKNIFENYKKDKFNININLNQEMFLESLSRILYLTDKDTNSVKIIFGDRVVSMEVNGNNIGEESIYIEPTGIKDSISLFVDAKNLREAINYSVGEVRWMTNNSEDIQYIVDANVVQFFFGLEE